MALKKEFSFRRTIYRQITVFIIIATSLLLYGPSFLKAEERRPEKLAGSVITGAEVFTVKGVSRSWEDADKTSLDRRPGPRRLKPVMNFKAVRRIVRSETEEDPVVQSSYVSENASRLPYMPEPLTSFAGMNLSENGAGWPPDTNGDVGQVYYIQTVNTSIGIYRKSDGAFISATTFDDFFEGGSVTGTPCDSNNNGDPIVLYDQYAQRWFLLDFAWDPSETDGSYYSIAVSQTSDPTGDWWLYAFRADTTLMNDYPKAGIWHDGIYITANMFQFSGGFQGVKVWALKKPDIYNGTLTAQAVFDTTWYAWSILPSNAKGSTPPPSNAPNYMYTFDADEWGYSPSDCLAVFKYDVDWNTPANTTWTGPSILNTAAFGLHSSNIPQSGTSNKLDPLYSRLMYPAQYRNLSSHESVYLCHLVDVGGIGAVRWYEVRISGGNSSIYQQGTYAPDSDHRWMGSIIADHQGNIVVGYSVSSSSMYPAIRYAGRLAADPAGQLAQGEASLIEGAGYQSAYNRWGDYSGMTIDPSDDETFWYTQEYYASSGINWQTRIGSFKIVTGPSITITSPNGGENWETGSSHDITWTSDGSVDNVKIEYSANNRADWTVITDSTTNDGLRAWTIPNRVSSRCFVRVTDAAGEAADISDTAFSIVGPPAITVRSPNGGETWETGSSQTITWKTTGVVGNVKIEYSFDDGQEWTVVTTSTANDGRFTWTVPGSLSDQCLVRIGETDGDPVDTGDGRFAITAANTLTVTNPNGGEEWAVGSEQLIQWKTTGTVGNINIDYSTDSGQQWISVIAGTANDGSYTWTVPDAVSDQCLVRVSETDGNPTDSSNAVFSIEYPPSVTVISPNGGESWGVGSEQDITWRSTGNITDVFIEYSVDNGATWQRVIDSTPNDGSYTWEVPENPSDNCLLRVIGRTVDGTASDTGDAVFSITDSIDSITVTAPNGGETWTAGSAQEITWTSTGEVSQVSIQLTVDNRNTWSTVTAFTANDGSYRWVVPDTPSTGCMIRISQSGADAGVSDSSNAIFTILSNDSPTLTVRFPDGGESLTAGIPQTITWESTGNIESVKIEYSIDNGDSWSVIAESVPDTGSYDWTIPDEPSDLCLVRISEIGGSASDICNAVFSILSPPTLSVISPNGGENLEGGTTQAITWNGTGELDKVKIEYSTDGGNTWNIIDSSTANDGSHNWTIPDITSNSCLVRISGSGDGGPSDTADNTFSIFPSQTPLLIVTSPNGGENWEGNSIQAITWNSFGTVGDVKIEYSVNNGEEWSVITASTANDGSYDWDIPDVAYDQCLVRVSGTGGDPTDSSNAVFSIGTAPTLTLLSPNGGETWATGSSHDITWTFSGSMESIIIEYSGDNGTTWETVGTSSPDAETYHWTVPETPSDECLIKISGSDPDDRISDISDEVFTISAGVTVTSPNGGETLTAGVSHEIAWSCDSAWPKVSIAYSSDGGETWTAVAESTDNTGSYDWMVPEDPSGTCLIRITGGPGDAGPTDTSDAVFSIELPSADTLTLLTPNGGESLTGTATYSITWSAGSGIANVKIEYSIDAGESWSSVVSAAANTGSCSWVVPDVSSELCLVRISDTADSSTFDVSDTPFSITALPTPELTVLSPNGGETLTAGTFYEITWTGSGGFDNVMLEYSTDNGASWTVIISSTPDDGSYTWTVPFIQADSCLVRISGNDGDFTALDISDAVFSIVSN